MPASHTKIFIHCVWAPWDRQPLLVPSIENRIHAAIAAKCEELRCHAIAIGGDLDHVHLLARIVPTLPVSQFVGEVKGASSHLMNHEIAPHREFRWQGSYGAFSVGASGVDKVAAYIRNQKEHHANRRTFEDWERCYEE